MLTHSFHAVKPTQNTKEVIYGLKEGGKAQVRIKFMEVFFYVGFFRQTHL